MIRKIAIFAVAVVLVLAMSVPAFADSKSATYNLKDGTYTKSITVNCTNNGKITLQLKFKVYNGGKKLDIITNKAAWNKFPKRGIFPGQYAGITNMKPENDPGTAPSATSYLYISYGGNYDFPAVYSITGGVKVVSAGKIKFWATAP